MLDLLKHHGPSFARTPTNHFHEPQYFHSIRDSARPRFAVAQHTHELAGNAKKHIVTFTIEYRRVPVPAWIGGLPHDIRIEAAVQRAVLADDGNTLFMGT